MEQIFKFLRFGIATTFVLGSIGFAMGFGLWVAESIPVLLDRWTGLKRPEELTEERRKRV